MKKIQIRIDENTFTAELYNTPTAKIIYDSLPFSGNANIWGNEIYFTIPVEARQEPEAKEEVNVGELAYWPVGAAFCIFFGPTPASLDNEPRAYSPVNIFGKILENTASLKQVGNGAVIRITNIKE